MKKLLLSRFALATVLAMALCGPIAFGDEAEEILSLLIERGEMLLTLSGDKPVSVILDSPLLDYPRAAAVLTQAQQTGRLNNPDLGWFVIAAAETPRFFDYTALSVPTEVPVGTRGLVLYNKSAIARLLQNPQSLEMLTEAQLKSSDTVAQAVGKIERFLSAHYHRPDRAKPEYTLAQHRTLGTLLGIPQSEVQAYRPGRESFLGGTPTLTLEGKTFSRGLSLTRAQPEATEAEKQMHSRYRQAADRYAQASAAGMSVLDFVNQPHSKAADQTRIRGAVNYCWGLLRRLLPSPH